MSNFATEQMLLAVQTAKESAKRAEKEYDCKAEQLQEKTGRSIDLFGRTAVSDVADIAAAARNICDTLYAAYQTLVRMLDNQCRPLLEQEPEIPAVRAVRDMIKWLNDESAIENNFTASLNSHDLGGVASVRYLPSIENKMIQSFWENTYFALPGITEFEAREKEAAAKKRKEEADIRKAEYEESKRKAKEETAKQTNTYQEKLNCWHKAVEQTKKKREVRIAQLSDEEAETLRSAAEAEYTSAVNALEQQKQQLQADYDKTQASLAQQGFFQLGEKIRLKKTVELLQNQLAENEKALKEAAYQKDKKLRDIPYQLKRKQSEWTEIAEKTFPMPEEPCPPGMTPQQFANKKLQNAIYDTLSQHKMLTIPELIEKCAAIHDLSEFRVKALLRGMLDDQVSYQEVARRAYYSAIPKKEKPRNTGDQEAYTEEKQAIYEYVKSEGRCTIGDINDNCIDTMHLNIRVISSLTRQLYQEGKLHKTEEGRTAYFEIV